MEKTMMTKQLLTLAAAVALMACSESPAPQKAETSGAPAAKMTSIDVPAGRYAYDPYHSSLSFSVTHLGLSNYVMRFTDFDVVLDLIPDDLSASKVVVTIDPTSVSTDFDGDYQGTHPDSPYSSWEEALAQSPDFLNASEHPTITFESTQVTPTEDGTLSIDGNLTLRGQTRPVRLDAELVGAVAQHPFFGVGALGFSASGTFQRSDFGMTTMLEPPLVGDTVTLRFESEFHQKVADSTAQSEQ